jgi:SNF2 family DNA or RNA helicase
LAELYAIVSFAVPGALAPDAATFRARIVKPIEAGSGAGASAKARDAADAAAARLARDQAGIVLRRSKESVAADALPTKRELVVFCPLGSEQV